VTSAAAGRVSGRDAIFAAAIAASFLLALFVAVLTGAVYDRPADGDAWTVFLSAAALLLLALLFVAAGLVTRRGWIKWVAPLLLLGPPLLLLSGAL